MNNQAPQGPSGLDREREQREREMEEQHMRERQMRMQQEEMVQREREHAERERQHREQYQAVPQHQHNAGAIPIHQPVASRLPGAIHSPGGLLANHGGGPLSNPLGGPAGSGIAFGGPLHADANRSMQHQNAAAAQQQQQHQMFNQNLLNHAAQQQQQNAPVGSQGGQAAVFGGPLGAEAAARSIQGMNGPFPNGMQPGHPAAGAQALGQGQQPILNDALSYLDQVKVQFSDQPDVYNRFLDIMKDFKSQAIDTPGVINRVSELFAGHPNLIQGFNTFLPPGYRIECGAGNDPNSIRVTTPMGTTVQSMTGRPALQETTPAVNGEYYPPRAGGWQQQRPVHSVESPEAMFSPQSRNAAPAYTQNQGSSAFEAQQAASAHQQEQRNVHHLQNAAATVGGQPPRHAITPTPGAQGQNGAQQPGMEKRGPVEFNHAISYVNKIKNRFQDKPEIYKQFLEILQTYQRESKPIQDVYAQVTTLFSDATDLLEDFKQFLPESAAQAKAAAKAAEDNAALAMASVAQTPQPIRSDVKLPVVGTFPPPSTTKAEGTKKRSRNNAPGTAPQIVTESSRASMSQPGNVNKRTKLAHTRGDESANDIEPTLMPNLPEPMPPASANMSDQRDIAFFDKVKKYLSNKQSFAEFLKLCNLFTMDLIDRNILVHKVSNFIGANSELMEQFKAMVGYTSPDEIIDNKPKNPSGRVSLSNCRGLGPSYRLLPRRERLKPCSGRDEMCYSVLNDDWASHPTWASEDSGFVAHRKNIFEEALHRIEEERHDYDFNIEANHKVIQLLEPIGQQICLMTKEQLQQFRMPVGLGGESRSIYKRILKKIYGAEQGRKVAEDLFNHPVAVLPIVLARLKQKDEEWRFTQREWEKVWHAQTQSMYMRSLDHMGIHVKGQDKKLFSTKYIVEQIKSYAESQKRLKSIQGKVAKSPLDYEFGDEDVILDAARFVVLYVTASTQYNTTESDRIATFVKDFISHFFGISESAVQERVKDIVVDSGDDEVEEPAPAELTNGRGRRVNGKKDLRRGVLDKPKGGELSRTLKEDSAASGSKESTPDIGSGVDDAEELPEAPDDRSTPDTVNEKWLSKNPTAAAIEGRALETNEFNAKPDAPFKRQWYNMYCNQSLYVFFTLFKTLYERLKAIKESEQDVADEIARNKAPKPAKALGLIAEKPDQLNDDGTQTFYSQTLLYVENFIDGTWEETVFQDFLRHYYLKKGWALYTVPDLIKNICRSGSLCAGNDNKDKSPEVWSKFKHNRANEETTYNAEISYRLSITKLVKDSDLFAIKYTPSTYQAQASLVNKDSTTLDLSMGERIERWKYYMASFVRIEPTEGIPRASLQKPILTRNTDLALPAASASSDEQSTSSTDPTGRKDAKSSEELVLRICVNSYKMLFAKGTSDWFYVEKMKLPAESVVEKRTDRFTEKFEKNVAWMKGLSQEGVQAVNENFQRWIEDGVVPPKDVDA